jgi:hypothetical protein
MEMLKMNFREVGCENKNWIELAYVMDFVIVMNFRFSDDGVLTTDDLTVNYCMNIVFHD